MPSETDLYFPVGDARYEAQFIPHVSLMPIPSLWGHPAGAAAIRPIARFSTTTSGDSSRRCGRRSAQAVVDNDAERARIGLCATRPWPRSSEPLQRRSPVAAQAASTPLLAQASAAPAVKPAAKPYVAPRTPDGHPDLQGVYDVATMTPVERPNGANLILTEKEAAALEQYEADRQVKNDAPLKGDREAPPVGGDTSPTKSYLEVLERAGGGVVGGYNNFWLAGGTKMIIVDGQKRSSMVVDPIDGRVPAMKPEARRRNAAFLAGAVAPDAAKAQPLDRPERSTVRNCGHSPSAACSGSARRRGRRRCPTTSTTTSSRSCRRRPR